MIKPEELNELDRIKTNDGRKGTVMLIMDEREKGIGFGMCVEFDNTSEVDVIEIEDVKEIIQRA